MRLSLAISVCLFLCSEGALVGDYAFDRIIHRDVAIIGGGAAGTYSAVRLKDMGKSVVVIEKDSVLGGMTDTYSKVPCYTDGSLARSFSPLIGLVLMQSIRMQELM